MAYVPDPTDITQPIDSVKAGTANEEFRALKAYIQGLVLGAVSQGPTVRQCALAGSLDSNGDPNFLSAGTGLALNLAALDAPLVLTYAAGSGAAGDINYSEAVGADATDVVTGLAPSNLSYITKLFNGAWDKTLAPCQYGKVFDKTAQMLMRWPGINGAVSSTEDFGNTLTFAGNAAVSTAVQILGQNTLAVDGAGDFVTVPFTSFGSGSWEIFGSFRTTSLAVLQHLFQIVNAGGLGVIFRITVAGLVNLFISNDGATQNIANGTAGTTVIAINTTYYYRLVFDALAGTYRLYLSNNGAAEVQDISVASALLVCSTATWTIGTVGADEFTGNIGFTGFRRFASFTSAQAVGPTVAPTFADVKSDFFNTQQMKMYEVTAVSTVAGTAPAMTAINKLHLAEAATGVATVTSVTNYAYKAKYSLSPVAVPANGTAVTAPHNIGVPGNFINSDIGLLCVSADSGKGAIIGDYTQVTPADNGVAAGSAIFTGRLSAVLNGSYTQISFGAKTSGARTGFTVANWKVTGTFRRSF